jgi:RND family efflux transporter MFP subunit
MITMETRSKEDSRIESKAPKSARLSALARAGAIVLIAAIAAGLTFVIHAGIRSRERAQRDLSSATLEAAVGTVSAVHPRLEAAAQEIILPGNVQAFVSTPIYARTNGYLKRWYFDIGSRVKTGQLLAEIETPEIDRELEQARADLATAQANLGLAQSTAVRYQNLLKSDSVSRQDTDEKVSDLHAKKAVVDSATANVHRLEETVRFQKVYAPFDGIITARNTDIGALINAGANAPGKELFDLAAVHALRVYVNVPQTYSGIARVGTPAYLTVAEMTGRRFAGRIVRRSDSIDPASRTLLTEVDVDNTAGQLLPGAYVSVHLKMAGTGKAVTLPVNTLLFRSEGLQVAVVRDGKAQLVNIKMGRDFGTSVEVTSGVTVQDLVIENPSDSIISGAPVRVAREGSGEAAR